MVKIDPYKHEERWNRWKERTANIINPPKNLNTLDDFDFYERYLDT